MVNREHLAARAARAYELARLRWAARAALYLIPLSVLCAFESGARETCACLGALLVIGALVLRWRSRRGVESVTTGLVAGSVPLFVGVLIARFAPSCSDAPLWSACTAVCLGLGVASGAWLGMRLAKTGASAMSGVAAAAMAVGAASLGCLQLGVGGLVGVAAGLLLGGATVGIMTKPVVS